jgi:ABC-type amino acid transport substrate-binding protein
MLRCWTAVLLILLTATVAAESPTLARIAETGEFRIGYVPDAPPLSFANDEGNVVGYSIDLCRHIASAIQFELGLDKLDVKFTPLVAIEDRISRSMQSTISTRRESQSSQVQRQRTSSGGSEK